MSRSAAAAGPGSTTPVQEFVVSGARDADVLDQVVQHADRCRRILPDDSAVADGEVDPDLRPDEGGGVLHVQGRREVHEGHDFQEKLHAGSVCVADELLHSLDKPVKHPLVGRIDEAVHRAGDRDHVGALPFRRKVDCLTVPVQRIGPHQAVHAVRVVVEKPVAERRDLAAFIVGPGPVLLPPGDGLFPRPANGVERSSSRTCRIRANSGASAHRDRHGSKERGKCLRPRPTGSFLRSLLLQAGGAHVHSPHNSCHTARHSWFDRNVRV